MSLNPVTTGEVYDVINNINSNKAYGYDEISPRTIKSVADIDETDENSKGYTLYIIRVKNSYFLITDQCQFYHYFQKC